MKNIRSKTTLIVSIALVIVVTAMGFGVSALGAGAGDTPRDGGHLRIATKSLGTLDPIMTNSDFDYAALSQVFNSLVRTGKDGNPIPDLAVSWENPNDLTWVFHLRKGVYWHDGNSVFPKGKSREVVADDVKYTIERIQDPETKSPFAGAVNSISSVEVVDNYTVKITTKYPDPFLLDSIRLAGIAIIPREAIEKLGPAGFARQPVGSGPFQFVEFVPDDHLTLKRNESYWIKPHLDKVTFKIIPDASVSVMSLEAGDVDVSLQVPPEEVARLGGEKGIVLHRSAQGWYRGLGFNVQTEPFNDIRVRKALSMAMDIDSAVKNVFGDNASRAYGQVPPSILGHDPSLKDLWTYDPEGALELLAEAGWKRGSDGYVAKDGKRLTVEIKTLNEPGRVKIITILVTQLKEIGIDAKMQIQEVGTWVADLQSGNTGLFMDFAYSGATGMHALFHSSNIGTSNTHFYADPEVDALLDQGSKTIDRAMREKVWKEAQRKVVEDVVMIPLYFEFGYTATSSKVREFIPQSWNLNLVSEENNVWLAK